MSAWQGKVDPAILADLEANFSGITTKLVNNGQIVGNDVIVAAHSLRLWTAHMDGIGATPDISAAINSQLQQPLSAAQFNDVRTLAYQIGTGPRMDTLLNQIQQTNTLANVQAIRQMIATVGIDGLHANMNQELVNFALKIQNNNGGTLLVNHNELPGGGRIIRVQTFCQYMAIAGLYAAVWAYMGWAGYLAIAAMMGSGAAVALGVVLAAIGVYCM